PTWDAPCRQSTTPVFVQIVRPHSCAGSAGCSFSTKHGTGRRSACRDDRVPCSRRHRRSSVLGGGYASTVTHGYIGKIPNRATSGVRIHGNSLRKWTSDLVGA